MSESKLITERQSPIPFAATACESGVLRGVVICGLSSANGRTYPADVLRKAVAKYEGAQVYLDHTGARDTRGVREWFGELRNVRSRPDGRPEGDLHYETTNAFAKEFEGRAKNFPRSLGLSHVAHCQTRRGTDGREVVESIESVESVDLVASPATNTSIHESTGGRTVALTVKQLCEALVRHPRVKAKGLPPLKTLSEMDGMDGVPTALDAAPGDDADPADGVKEAFKTAVMHIVEQAMNGDMDPKEALGKIKKLINSHGEVNGDGAPVEPDADDDPTTPEGKKRQTGAILEALDVCESVGFAAKRADLEIVAAVPAQSRKSVAERLKKAAATEGGGPRSHGRGTLQLPDPATGKVTEGVIVVTGWQD